MWPTAVQVHTKLYGSKEELEKAATVILQTGLSAWQRLRRRKKMSRPECEKPFLPCNVLLKATRHSNNNVLPIIARCQRDQSRSNGQQERQLTEARVRWNMYLLERASRRLGALHIRPEASELCDRLMWCRSPPAPSKRVLSSWSNSTVLVGDWAALGD